VDILNKRETEGRKEEKEKRRKKKEERGKMKEKRWSSTLSACCEGRIETTNFRDMCYC
jgi:hypothetical protein